MGVALRPTPPRAETRALVPRQGRRPMVGLASGSGRSDHSVPGLRAASRWPRRYRAQRGSQEQPCSRSGSCRGGAFANHVSRVPWSHWGLRDRRGGLRDRRGGVTRRLRVLCRIGRVPSCPVPRVEYKCATCGKSFTDYPSQRPGVSSYCSRACRAADPAYRKRLRAAVAPAMKKRRTLNDIPCQQCGTMFLPSSSRRRYCSRPCWYDANRRHPKATERPCEACGSLFKPTGPQLTRGHGRYCSKRCWADTHRRRTAHTCVNCRSEFAMSAKLARSGQRFCSRECWGQFRWRNGLLSESHRDFLLKSPRARSRWFGRWNGKLGALDGSAGGRPAFATLEQRVAMLRLLEEGLSYRQVAKEVFGDDRLKDRVARFAHA